MPEENQPMPGNQRIAIAGATGRVGSALIKLLASDPVDVVALSRRARRGRPANRRRCRRDRFQSAEDA